MNEILILVFDLVMGVLIGIIFFGGLWWTVRKGLASKQIMLWISGSLAVRMSIALVGFYFIGANHWERMLVCLLGFIIARVIVMRILRILKKPAFPFQEASHAPYPR